MNHTGLANFIAFLLLHEDDRVSASDVGGSSSESIINVTDKDTGKEFVVLVRALDEDAEDEDW